MLSRREWIGRLLALGGLVAATRQGRAAVRVARVSKVTAKYQDSPKNMQMCGMCKFYVPTGGRAGAGMMGGHMGCGHMGGMMAAGTCELVEGSISPMGWCVLYHRI